MNPVHITPDSRYRSAMFVAITLILVPFFFSWTIPLGTFALAQVMRVSIALALVVAVHLAVLALGLWLGTAYVRSIRYEIWDDEIVGRAGIITKSVKHVPFRTVTNLKVTRGPIDRMFGLGSLHVQTAGMSGQTGAEETLVGLADAQAVYEQVVAELHRFRGALGPTQAAEEPAVLARDADLMAALLAEVRAIRARLEAERPAG